MLLQSAASVAKTDPNAPTNGSIDTASLLERQRALNNKHREVLTQLATLTTGEVDILAGAEYSETQEFNRQLNLLANAYETHLDALTKLKAIQDARQDFQQKAQAWVSFPHPPPYSLTFIQDQWQQVRLKDREIESARIELAVLDTMVESHRQAFELSLQNSRKAVERLESSSNLDRERNRWLKDFNDIRKQQQEARLALLATEREVSQENLSHLLEQQAFLQRKARLSSRTSPLSLMEKNVQIKQLESLRQKLNGETAQTLEQYQKAQQHVLHMRDRLVNARERWKSNISHQAKSTGSSLLQQALDTAMIERDALASNLKVLRLLMQAVEVNRQVWELQYRTDNTKDLQVVEAVSQDIESNLQRLAPWREYLNSDLDTVRSWLDAQEKRLRDWNQEYGDRDQEQRKLQAYQRQEALLKRGVAEADQLEARLHSLADLLQWRYNEADMMQRLRFFAKQAIVILDSLSDFELLTIDDTIIADGREITGKRRVTVGKIVHILAIFIIGFWSISRLTRYSREKVAGWESARASSALLGLRLFSLTAVVAILMFALISAHIPLTVLTLLGGTLAIGVGFGAQNLLNNFISGLILLMERSIKIGDIVEVEGILSRVTHIGSRCCQVQRFDGIDMLIPNSSFLEKTVTNWTLSDNCLRFSIQIGVAYGASASRAMALTKRAATEHPRVMKAPEPEIYLADFAADALILRLDFWIDLENHTDRYRVLSDIRLRIEQLFAEADIVIPFQQRDVHLDVVKPLKVEMINTNSASLNTAPNA